MRVSQWRKAHQSKVTQAHLTIVISRGVHLPIGVDSGIIVLYVLYVGWVDSLAALLDGDGVSRTPMVQLFYCWSWKQTDTLWGQTLLDGHDLSMVHLFYSEDTQTQGQANNLPYGDITLEHRQLSFSFLNTMWPAENWHKMYSYNVYSFVVVMRLASTASHV